MKNLFFLFISTLMFSQNINFTWIHGSKETQQDAEFGIYGLESEDNWPNVLSHMAYTVDNEGTFWMFGGKTTGNTSDGSNLLWSCNLQNNNFRFRKGLLYYDFDGFNKGLNIESYRNFPKPVWNSSIWASKNKTLYVLGGGNASLSLSKDFWKFNIDTNNWTKLSNGTPDGKGVFGIKGVENASNFPPDLTNVTTWTDADGNLYLFGGNTSSSYLDRDEYNTVWKYNVSTNMWSWISGSDQPNVKGNYDALGKESALNFPSARYSSCTFKDAQGNIYIYGGFHNIRSYTFSYNDLWKFNINTKQWTWLKGDETSTENIVADVGVENSNNLPGVLSLSYDNPKPNNWVDKNGDFWILVKNNMWRYRLSTNSWTLMKITRNPLNDGQTVYGTKNVEDSNNFPGEVNNSACWTGSDGNLYMFNGSNTSIYKDVLWKYNTKTNNWVWIKGEGKIYPNNITTYQKLAGLLESENTPGGTIGYGAKWNDEEGNLWIYGICGTYNNEYLGTGYVSDDLWKFNTAQKKWQWINGYNNSFYKSYKYIFYGSLNVEDKKNNPGARFGAMSWIDKNGNLWMFGGRISYYSPTYFQDLWMYNRKTNVWVWKGGNKYANNGLGNYGIKGVYSTNNIPGAREKGKTWTDKQGNFYLYGGYGSDGSSSKEGCLNDLWKYDISINQWAWLSGDNTINNKSSTTYPIASEKNEISWEDLNNNFWYYLDGNMWKYQTDNNTWSLVRSSRPYTAADYGILGVENESNFPARRNDALTWVDKNGDLWLLGGFDSNSKLDLWRFNINTNNWTWMYGYKWYLPPNYGQINVPSQSNIPPVKLSSATWNDKLGNLYYFGGIKNIYDTDSYNDVWVIDLKQYYIDRIESQNLKGKFTIYPKIIKDEINIESDVFFNSLKLTDFTGRNIIEFNFEPDNGKTINLSNLKTGNYLLSIYMKNKLIYSTKIIKSN